MPSGIIWIIEKGQGTPAPTVSAALLGDYAVRLFASFSSLRQITRFDQRQVPDMVIVDRDHCPTDILIMEDFYRSHFLNAKRIYLSSKPQSPITADNQCFFLLKPFDSLEFSHFVGGLLTTKKTHDEVIRYRNIVLNVGRFYCQVLPFGEEQNLSMKEVKLLKLFIEQAGACLEREAIHSSIWQDVKVSPRTIDSHISRLRRKLVDAEATIESVYGGGYILR